MDKDKELLIRLNEQLGIYKDSPNMQLTYIDMARLISILIDIINVKDKIGFKK